MLPRNMIVRHVSVFRHTCQYSYVQIDYIGIKEKDSHLHLLVDTNSYRASEKPKGFLTASFPPQFVNRGLCYPHI